MMKQRTRWMIALTVTVTLLLALLYGCQASAAPAIEPSKSIESQAPETVEIMATAPERTEAAVTELPENGTEATQATDNMESAQATEAPTEAPTEATDATTEPEAPSSPKPDDPKPTEPKATEPKPTAPKPTEAKPSPAQPKPTQPKPTEPKPITPTPTQPKPTEPKPTEPKPTNPPHSHSWSAWTQTTAPTCSSAGEETRRCSCGAKESRSVAATGNHSWSETAPTCTATGVKTCKTCGKTESTAALGHNWVHHDEEVEYLPVLTCYCGMRFIGKPGDDSEAYAAWNIHANLSNDLDYLDEHAGYEGHEERFVINSAYDVCSRCGATNP